MVKVHVTLDWLIDVRGTDDLDVAKEAAYNYVADQELEESVEYLVHEDETTCDPQTSPHDDDYDAEATVTLYPEGEAVPADERGSWATYEVGLP